MLPGADRAAAVRWGRGHCLRRPRVPPLPSPHSILVEDRFDVKWWGVSMLYVSYHRSVPMKGDNLLQVHAYERWDPS